MVSQAYPFEKFGGRRSGHLKRIGCPLEPTSCWRAATRVRRLKRWRYRSFPVRARRGGSFEILRQCELDLLLKEMKLRRALNLIIQDFANEPACYHPCVPCVPCVPVRAAQPL